MTAQHIDSSQNFPTISPRNNECVFEMEMFGSVRML